MPVDTTAATTVSSNDMRRFRVLLQEARRYRNCDGGEKEVAYVRFKTRLTQLDLALPYEDCVRQLCEALRY